MKKKLFIITNTKEQKSVVTGYPDSPGDYELVLIDSPAPYMERKSIKPSFLEEGPHRSFDCLYLRTLEQLGTYQDLPSLLLLDNSIPILNHSAYEAYKGLLSRDFYFKASYEQTIPELSTLYRGLSESGRFHMVLPLYGYIPLMISAGCSKNTIGTCDKVDAITNITDRKGVLFPVANYCKPCINVIFNSLPYCGYELLEKRNFCPDAGFVLEFTIESIKVTKEVLDYLFPIIKGGLISKPPFKYTTGHLKRPVE